MKFSHISFLFSLLLLASCQNDDIDIAAPVLQGIPADQINGDLQGDDYVLTFPAPASGQQMNVATYVNNNLTSSETVSGTQFVHRSIDTNTPYTYVFKLTDGKNFSTGAVKTYTREGAEAMTGLAMSQTDREGGYDINVEWNANPTATSVSFAATNGSRSITETLPQGATSYIIPDVTYGEEWQVTLRASNDKGPSLPTVSALKIGKTAVAFLSAYNTPEELVANGDDDEASAWLWTHATYPSAHFVPFSTITSASVLEPYRVAFYIRDLEGVGEGEVWAIPQAVADALPALKDWYRDGGNLLLWSHATVMVGWLGRLDLDMLKGNDHAFGTGFGGYNGDVWAMAVQLHPGSRFKKDFSNHPIYKGLEYTETDRTKLIKFKGPGWTEDHNCLFFNIPSVLTGIGNQEETCYAATTDQYGIYPLGTWDSQIDWVSQLNVWEAQQGNTEFRGTILCVGNGGCEFSLRNPDGTPDISACPTNNIYQANVLRLAQNSIEYLKTR